MKNHTLGLLDKLNQDLNGDEFYANVKRKLIIPEELTQDEIENYNLSIVFDVDRRTFNRLCECLDEQAQNGEIIENWIKRNK